MGLDFTNSKAHWSYSGFNKLREELAQKLYGIDLKEIKGFGGEKEFPDVALKPFLNHSDCDGELTPAEMGKCMPELYRALPLLEDAYDIINLARLIDGMDRATARNDNLEFI